MAGTHYPCSRAVFTGVFLSPVNTGSVPAPVNTGREHWYSVYRPLDILFHNMTLINLTQLNLTQLNLLIYGSCEAGLNKHREHIIKHKA